MKKRADGRTFDEIRPLQMALNFTEHPLGSVMISAGRTQILCTVSLEEKVPHWMKGKGKGWLTSEYSMLPASTHTRSRRERRQTKGRTLEIQRLIGRSLRSSVDFSLLGERTLYVDCDVIQADGGTRTASVTGGFVALALACDRLLQDGKVSKIPLIRSISALSCGVVDGELLLDLPYEEDVRAEVDMNLVMTGEGDIVEIQATGEGGILKRDDLNALVTLGEKGCREIRSLQAEALSAYPSLAFLFA